MRARVTMPIVLAASCSPCPRAMAAADTLWAMRNPRLTRPGWALRNTHMISVMKPKPRMMPAIGETIIGMMTLLRMPVHSTVVPAAMLAPAMPPTRAWEDEDGRPYHHVMRFQPTAPMRAPAMMARPSIVSGGSMMPEPTVRATPSPRKAPTRLKKAAMANAKRGVSARVDTEVAMALAASWNPLV